MTGVLLKLTKTLIIVCSPGLSYNATLIENNEIVQEVKFWGVNLKATITDMLEKYEDIAEIKIRGHRQYIAKIVKLLQDDYPEKKVSII